MMRLVVQPGKDAAEFHRLTSPLLVNAEVSCADEEDHSTGRRLEGEADRNTPRV